MKYAPLLVALAFGCNAEFSVGEVSVNGEKVHEDLTVPRSFELTPAYGEKHGVKIPLRAHVEVPRGDSVVVQEGKAAGGAWIRFDFPDSSGKKIAERLSVAGLKVGMGEPKERMAALEKLLVQNVLPQVAQGSKDLQFHGSRPATIDGNNAVLVTGQFTAPGGETFFVGLAATLLAESEQGVLVVGQAVLGTGPIKAPDEIGTKGALFNILQTLKVSPAK